VNENGREKETHGSKAGFAIIFCSKEIDANGSGTCAVVVDTIIDSTGLAAYIAQGAVE
jgi:hypothetical protein